MKVASDKHRFDVVWKGRWYQLGSLSDHHHRKIDPTGPVRMLIDRMSRVTLAPADEIAIPTNPLPR